MYCRIRAATPQAARRRRRSYRSGTGDPVPRMLIHHARATAAKEIRARMPNRILPLNRIGCICLNPRFNPRVKPGAIVWCQRAGRCCAARPRGNPLAVKTAALEVTCRAGAETREWCWVLAGTDLFNSCSDDRTQSTHGAHNTVLPIQKGHNHRIIRFRSEIRADGGLRGHDAAVTFGQTPRGEGVYPR